MKFFIFYAFSQEMQFGLIFIVTNVVFLVAAIISSVLILE